nr:hypothetical protein CFP56_79427 [Quercus suber]
MAQLTSLPNELLLLVFTQCPTIKSAVLLSSTNGTLRDIWLRFYYEIVTSILKRDLPSSACKAAIDLAKDEARLMSSSPSGSDDSASGAFVPRLAFHTDAASRTCAQYLACLTTLNKPKKSDGIIKAVPTASLTTAYYVARRLVLSYHFPELQPALSDELETAPLEDVATYLELAEFMHNCVDDEDDGLLSLQETRYTANDEMDGYPATGAWKYAVNSLLRTYAKRRLTEQAKVRNSQLDRQFEMSVSKHTTRIPIAAAC